MYFMLFVLLPLNATLGVLSLLAELNLGLDFAGYFCAGVAVFITFETLLYVVFNGHDE